MKKNLRSNMSGNGEKNKDIYENMDKDKVKEVKNIYSKYAGKDEAELKQKLVEMAKQGKEDGSLNNNSIDNMAKKIAPMLDKEKQAKLNSIISMLKDN